MSNQSGRSEAKGRAEVAPGAGLKKEVAEGVLTLTLDRPDALNAIRPEMLTGLAEAIRHARETAEVSVVVLTGAGRAFSAGVDLKVLQGIRPRAGRIGDVFDAPAREVRCAIRELPKPVIARVQGFCFTGALELALQCDFLFTTKTTKFGDTHAKFGLRPTWGMSQTLSQAVGIRRAKELSFTARTFLGEEAARWGLANEAVDDVEALDRLVAERCAQIVSNSAAAVAALKDLYGLAQQGRAFDEALDQETRQDYPAIEDTARRLADF
jgi:enoyl-CoA hydratase/carnithine racemase